LFDSPHSCPFPATLFAGIMLVLGLVLVTDGVTEVENAAGEFFENDRRAAVAKAGGMQ